MTNKKYILKDRKLVEASLGEWAEFMEGKDKIIKQETLPNGKRVSTVFLGIEHQFGDGEPLLFETMVFPEKGNFSDEDMERYSTLEEAESGHKRMVEKHLT